MDETMVILDDLATDSRIHNFYKTVILTNQSLTLHAMEKVASYIIYKDGATTVAYNGKTGKIDFQSTDSTTVIQSALNKKGTIYIADSLTIDGVSLQSDTHLIFSYNSILTRNNNSSQQYILSINGISNVIISNAVIDGNKTNNSVASDNIFITGSSSNIRIENVISYNSAQDGLYIGRIGSTPGIIFVSNCTLYNNSRSGMSITNGRDIYISNNITHDNGLHGIDIEPNAVGDVIDNIVINSLTSYNNSVSGSAGINILCLQQTGIIYISNSNLHNNYNGITIDSFSGVLILQCKFNSNTNYGINIPRNVTKIEILNCDISSNNIRGISFVTSGETIISKEIKFIGNRFYNNSQNPSNTYDGMRIDASLSINTVTVSCNSFFDDQSVHTQRYGFTIGNNVTNVKIINNNFYGNVSGSAIIPTSSNTIRGNTGFITENDILSGTFAIDSTGVKTVTIAHGLDITSNIQDCYLTIIQNTAVDDWAYNMLKIVSVDATNAIAKINVSTQSATAGATAKLGLRIGNP